MGAMGDKTQGDRPSLPRTYGELVRLPNLFSAAGDVLAGFLLAGGTGSDAATLGPAALASVLFYAGGVVLNDVCDAGTDSRERPERPIPSGRVSRRSAARLAATLLACGLVASWWVGPMTVAIAVGLVAAIVLYDAVAKPTAVGPLVMGCCRGLNLALGISAGPSPTAAVWGAPILTGAYVAALTWYARDEAVGASPGRLRLVSALIAATVLGQLLFAAGLPDANPHGWWVVPCVSVAVLLIALRGARAGSPREMQRAVGRLILGIVFVDAALVACVRGVQAAMLVAALAVPMWMLKRRFRPT